MLRYLRGHDGVRLRRLLWQQLVLRRFVLWEPMRLRSTRTAIFLSLAAGFSPAAGAIPRCGKTGATLAWKTAPNGKFDITISTAQDGWAQVSDRSWQGPLKLELVFDSRCSPEVRFSIHLAGTWKTISRAAIVKGAAIEVSAEEASKYFGGTGLKEVFLVQDFESEPERTAP